MKEKDYTPGGLRLEGQWENDRNAENRDLYAAILREVYGADQCIIAHHITYSVTEKRDGSDYYIVEEIPSADTLIFDHAVARTLWGSQWHEVLMRLAVEPVETRDALLAQFFYTRSSDRASHAIRVRVDHENVISNCHRTGLD